MRSSCRAARPSGSMPAAASRLICTSRAGDLPSRDARVPLVCGAVLFDLLNGGDKNWGRYPPYRELGYVAAAAAAETFALGTAGAGFGATTINLKGGLGSASAITGRGHTVGALVAVNACGSATVGDGPHFWAAPFEAEGEFGGLGFPSVLPPTALKPLGKGGIGENTTIAMVATDAALTKAQARQFAVMAQDGLARAIYPAHTTLDGDTVFAAATGRRPLRDPITEIAELGAVGANVARPVGGAGGCSRPLRCLAGFQAGRIATVRHFLTKGPEFH